MSKFLVFRCTRCSHFLYAPITQKTRFCPYCQKVIKIDHFRGQLVRNTLDAGDLVRQYNAGESIEEFQEASDQNAEEIKRLLEITGANMDPKPIQEDIGTGSMKLLIRILSESASKQALTFQELHTLVLRFDLPWSWTTTQIEDLAKTGQVIFPNPWSVRYIVSSGSNPGHQLATRPKPKQMKQTKSFSRKGISKSDLLRLIFEYLNSASSPITVSEIAAGLGESEMISEIEDAIHKLLQQGRVFEPSPGKYKAIM